MIKIEVEYNRRVGYIGGGSWYCYDGFREFSGEWAVDDSGGLTIPSAWLVELYGPSHELPLTKLQLKELCVAELRSVKMELR